MKQKLVFIFILFLAFKSLSQIEGKYTFKSFDNQCYKEKSVIEDDNNISFHCKENEAHLYLNKIILSAKDYITNRTNSEFYNNLKINHLEISIGKSNVQLSDYSKFHKHWYWINYTCKIKEIFYSIAFRFNEDGNMIENINFPNYDNKLKLDQIINPKLAIKKARSIRKSLKRDKISITLEYLTNENLLCYRIQKDPEVAKNIKNNTGIYKNISNFIYINAYTNELVKKETKKQQILGSGVKIHAYGGNTNQKK